MSDNKPVHPDVILDDEPATVWSRDAVIEQFRRDLARLRSKYAQLLDVDAALRSELAETERRLPSPER